MDAGRCGKRARRGLSAHHESVTSRIEIATPRASTRRGDFRRRWRLPCSSVMRSTSSALSCHLVGDPCSAPPARRFATFTSSNAARSFASDRAANMARFWNPSTIQPLGSPDVEVAENLRTQTELALAGALAGSSSDVASYLSAGRDNGLVTASAARQLARDGRDLDAFTAVPRDGYAELDGRYLYDEVPVAARVAASYPSVRHHYFQSGRFALCEASTGSILPCRRRTAHRSILPVTAGSSARRASAAPSSS